MKNEILNYLKEKKININSFEQLSQLEIINSPIILNIILKEDNPNLINFFSENAWNEENICLLFEKYPDIQRIPWNIMPSTKCLHITIKNNFFNQIDKFIRKAVTEDILNLFIEKCKLYEIKEIPFIFSTQDLLNKLIENNLLYYASSMNSRFWNDDIIKSFCKQLDNYPGKLNYDTIIYLNNSEILYSLLKNKRYEKIYLMNNWNNKCIDLIINNIDDYLQKGYKIPIKLYDNSNLLNTLLKNKKLEYIEYFNTDAWNEENIYLVVNLIYKGELEYRLLPFNLRNIPLVNSMLYNFINNHDRNIDNTKKTNLINNLNNKSLLNFILQIDSTDLYLYINSLINNDINNIDKYFDSFGPKKELLDLLIFNKAYQSYCNNNNIDIIKDINDTTLLNYLKFIELFPDLHKFIYIDNNNYKEYFDDFGPKIELYNFLFNINAFELLYYINQQYTKLDNKKQLILNKSMSIDAKDVRKVFIKYCLENYDNYNEEQIDNIYTIIKKIENSNSSEIRHIRESLTNQLLNCDKPLERLEEIEKIFLKKYIPHVVKVYFTFKIMHPNYNDFDFSEKSTICPSLKISNDLSKDVIVFTKLLLAQLGSNNHELKEFFKKVISGNALYMEIISGKKRYLKEEEIELLNIFKSLVEIIYNNSLIGNKKEKIIIKNLNDLNQVINILNTNKRNIVYIPDRVVNMFCHNAGFDTVESILSYSDKYLKEREEYHKALEKQNKFILGDGYLVKGINSIRYLENLVKYGVCCKETLGDCAGSDATKLDTDVSLISGSYSNNKDAIKKTVAKDYGKTFLVFKIDDRSIVTRDQDGIEKPVNRKNTKIEVFKTGYLGKDHYGIGIAAAFSDVEYIITEEYDYTFGVTLAINGIYVPVVDMQGKLLFTFDDYLKIRNNMQGLSYYGENDYNIASDIDRDDLKLIEHSLKDNELDTNNKRKCIINTIREGIELDIRTTLSVDLDPGSIEIIDTGSTGRGTNVPGDGDFDFIIRLDREIIIDEDRLTKLKKQIAESLGKKYTSGDFRFENVSIEGLEQSVDIDITFIAKSNKVEYTTEECIKDRLATIKRKYPDKYNYVLSNIILAKQLFKKYGCYKPKHAGKGKAQGGLGGVGVENWILQHGGSLIEAANSFLECAKGKSFEEFINSYPVYDFGINHLAERNNKYPYDNFINNLDKEGYNKMLQALNDYVNNKVDFNENVIIKK